MIQKTPWHSWKNGNLARGCKLCVKGEKTILFITGLCSKSTLCYYCPIADNRSGKDVIYANETKITNINELFNEIKLCSSKGMGITGGDPLMKLNRTIEYIKAVKQEFGKDFHIHLYCPMELVSDESLKKLYEAGLDEIRFHLDIENKINWNKLDIARKFRWKIGIEIPVVPGKEDNYIGIISFIKGKVDFLNLNELEISDSEVCKLADRGFVPKNDFSYAIKGSEELALGLLKRSEDMNIHYCTIKLKDDIQIPQRLKNRLKNIKHNFDDVNGCNIIRGAIYTRELKPGFGYRNMLENIKDKEFIIKNLENIKSDLMKKLSISKDMMAVDSSKLRILTSKQIVKKFRDKIKSADLIPAIVEELPSGDLFEIEIEFL